MTADTADTADTEATGTAAPPDGPAALPLRPALEAVLMVVDEPATEEHLAKVLGRPRRAVAAALRELADEYTAQERGFELRQVAGGWRFYARPAYAPAVEGFVLDGQHARLTQAALETLAVVAYRQPVSRSRVSAIRGVNCDGVMRTLLQRGLVAEAGTEPETGAILYGTTHYFLERMGLRGLDELPELAPFLPEADQVEGESREGVPSFSVDADADDSGDSPTDH
ncbi:SMC-Scp complex subunit ScpB [Streptomyces sp. MS19]|uniref:SMC-Scp complex subunit ScpB n=1 Tax=Streptomyces sp. MS19 TaxID=3385972 RepID=UPI0039A01264